MPTAFAQSVPTPDSAQAIASSSSSTHSGVPVLPTVVVRSVVEEVKLDADSANSAVITQDQLREQNALDLGAALRRTPGVQISRYNPVGAFGGDQGGAVYIRGMGASRPGSEIKTYVDGVPFYMGLWSHPLLDLLPINGMQSITVHKSPQPLVNGNNFASIDLVPRKATEEGLQGDARVSAGTYGTLTEQLNLTGKDGDLDWGLSQGFARSDGHRKNADGKLSNLMGRVGYRLDGNWSVAASLLHVDNKAKDPGDQRIAAPDLAPQYNTKASLFTTSFSHVHDNWRGELKLYTSHGRGDWLDQPAPDGNSINKFRMSGLRWREQFSAWQGGVITAGLDHDRIAGDATFERIPPALAGYFDGPTFKITSPYVGLRQEVPLSAAWSLVPSVGIRLYDHSQFGSETAPYLGVSLVSDVLTVYANLSRGINYPGLETPLLSSLIPALGSTWKSLSAEKMDHAEVGFKWSVSDATQIDVSWFQDKVKNRYVFGFPPDVPPPPQFLNLGGYTMRGMELSLRQAIGAGWSGFVGLTLLDPSMDNLPYSPRKALTVGASGNAGPVRVSFDAQYQSAVWALSRARGSDASNTERVPGFAIANLRAAYPLPALGNKGEIFIAVENLFDRDYAYRPGYPMAGRSAQVGISASF